MLFLACDESRFITGTPLVIDGGRFDSVAARRVSAARSAGAQFLAIAAIGAASRASMTATATSTRGSE